VPCRNFHHSANRIDKLIGAMGVFPHMEPTRIFIGKRRNHDASPGIIFGNATLSQQRDMMALRQNPTEWLINGVGNGPAVSLHYAV
jgi:hypothetical protein